MGKLLDLFKGQAAAPAPRTAPAGPAFRPAPGKQVPIKIVGEASYQGYIAEVYRRHRDGEFGILLRAEPDNRYDRNAVAVLVDGGVVGYLPRDFAPQWQPIVLAAISEGYVITGTAKIYGGTQDKPHLGVFGSAVWPGKSKPPRAER